MNSEERDFRAVRFGLGPARSGEDWSPDGALAMVTGMTGAERYQVEESAAKRYATAFKLRLEERKTRKSNPAVKFRGYADYAVGNYQSDANARILWAANSKAPFAERVLAFWSNHFTVSVKNPQLRFLAGPFEATAIMPHIAGDFATLLRASSMHQGMLVYLDQMNSVGPNSKRGKRRGRGLNENLAREILELHTLGVHGGYSQADVTQFAKVMTGWTVNRETGEAVYDEGLAEPGRHKVLGQSFPGGARGPENYGEVLDLLAAHPATARHIAVKMVRHFISDSARPEDVQAVESAYLKSRGNLPAVYRALLTLPDAGTRPGAKARNDRDFLIAGLRTVGVTRQGENMATGQQRRRFPLTFDALFGLRQPYWGAASPAGWSEEAGEWLSAAGLAGRLQLIPKLVTQTAATPEELIVTALGATATDRTRKMVSVASNRDEALALVLASPEFNRR